MIPTFADPAAVSLPLHGVAPEGLEAWRAALDPATAAWISACGFEAGLGELRLLPGEGGLAGAVLGLGSAKARSRSRFALARAAALLPLTAVARHPNQRRRGPVAQLVEQLTFNQ